MNCKRSEKFLLRFLEKSLNNSDKEILDRHYHNCIPCQKRIREYQKMLELMKIDIFPEPKPYFWERLKSKLKEQKKSDPWFIWKRWGLRAIPLSLLVIIFLSAAIFFFIPPQTEELSQSEVLLLRNLNPFPETRTLMEEEGVENQNMMLIFTSLEENNGIRRYYP